MLGSGPGIPEEALNKVFDRFYRAEASRSRATGGSGLGLSIVKTLVELHQGTVAARNQAIDQAVQAQRLTTEQANALKASSQAVAKAFVAQPVQLRLGMASRDGRGPRGWWR